jgi:hypothetical protein
MHNQKENSRKERRQTPRQKENMTSI